MQTQMTLSPLSHASLATEVIAPLASNTFVRERLIKHFRSQAEGATAEDKIAHQFVMKILQHPLQPILSVDWTNKRIQEYGARLLGKYYEELCLQSLYDQKMTYASSIPESFQGPREYIQIVGVTPNWAGVGQTWLQNRSTFILKLPLTFRNILNFWLQPCNESYEKSQKELKELDSRTWETIREVMWRRCEWATLALKDQQLATEVTITQVKRKKYQRLAAIIFAIACVTTIILVPLREQG